MGRRCRVAGHLDDEVVAWLGSHLEPGSAGEVPVGGEPMPVMVAIADDLPVARQGLRDYLQCQGDLEVVAAVDSGAALLEILGEIGVCPDVALVDARMSSLDGIEATRRIQERFADVKDRRQRIR
jgi:CheY-like chemotaxis protein